MFLVLGLVSASVGIIIPQTILVSAILAVVCGHMARARFKGLGRDVAGRRIATAGLVLGYLPLVAFACTTLLLSAMIVLGQENGPFARYIHSLF